ncbi:hypothetical protein [Prolixibacter denitrificans]|uniref:Uncharacterized protein n=1 Tax=Prolixibacter denitrificans TaxID=1541063 RepID=A0A2P8C5F6_9BACT|nr:hypothetical protein [Prolixibacter denitrificans]PSK80192.1 hypothetical protein CLV93_1217 [Prolixibacter denitrificans]GET22379.1 hypothetical protein JCM18694_26250 [Prolixibacter denitrificans]
MTKSNLTNLFLLLVTIFFLSVIFALFDSSTFTGNMTAYDAGYAMGHSTGIFLKHTLRMTIALAAAYLIFINLTKSRLTNFVLLILTVFFLSIIFALLDSPTFTSHMSAYDAGYAMGSSTGIIFRHMFNMLGTLAFAYLLLRKRTARK